MKKNLVYFETILLFILFIGCNTMYSQNIEQEFKNPPMRYRPYVWWHWMGPNVSKSGITKDLEAMQEVGIGGATIFNLTSAVMGSNAPLDNTPWPDQTYRSEKYWENFEWACKEAERLGMELGHHNSPGYSTTGGPWIDEVHNMEHLIKSSLKITGHNKKVILDIAQPKLTQSLGIGANPTQPTIYKEIGTIAVSSGTNKSNKTYDLSKNYNKKGQIVWTVPEGEWSIFRIGLCHTMAVTHPTPDDVFPHSLEVDKIDAAKGTFHWENALGPLKEHLGKFFGKTFKHILIDSYEAGLQDWGENVRNSFIQMKGYDPITYIPILITSKDDSLNIDKEKVTRFKEDYREVMSKLFNENSWKLAKQKVNDEGLQLQCEAYWGLYSIVAGSAVPDIPYGEFWTDGNGMIEANVTVGARAGGHKLIGAEAFSTRPKAAHWTEDPAFLKASAEGAFSSGVNHLSLHQWVMQPFEDKYQPGYTMGWWGTHFSRFQPWFKLGKAFYKYLGRCQYLLQQGEQVIEYLLVQHDGINNYELDAIAPFDFLDMDIKVDNRNIILPSGRKYPIMEIASNGTMHPEILIKVEKLLEQGATIVIAQKPTKSPSLTNYPTCDQDVKTLAGRIWNNYLGKHLFRSRSEAEKAINYQPDYLFVEGKANIVHRHSNNDDFYYIGNTTDKPQHLVISLRSQNRLPELWNAENGNIGIVENWKFDKDRTIVTLDLKAYQSRFIVFRMAATEAEIAEGKHTKPTLKKANQIVLARLWDVHFEPKLSDPFDKQMSLIDFSKSNDKNIKYFAGTAIYKQIFNITKKDLTEVKKVMLNFGEVNDIAAVSINNTPADTIWYAPFVTDISKKLHPGKNTITIEVAVNWPNLLIGDEQYPQDIELKEPTDYQWFSKDIRDIGHPIKEFPEWFLKNQKRPTQRKAFATWNYFFKDTPLQKAGLAGPVTLEFYK